MGTLPVRQSVQLSQYQFGFADFGPSFVAGVLIVVGEDGFGAYGGEGVLFKLRGEGKPVFRWDVEALQDRCK